MKELGGNKNNTHIHLKIICLYQLNIRLKLFLIFIFVFIIVYFFENIGLFRKNSKLNAYYLCAFFLRLFYKYTFKLIFKKKKFLVFIEFS